MADENRLGTRAAVERSTREFARLPEQQQIEQSYQEVLLGLCMNTSSQPEPIAGLILKHAQIVAADENDDKQRAAICLLEGWELSILQAAARIMQEIDPQVNARLRHEATLRLMKDVGGDVGEPT